MTIFNYSILTAEKRTLNGSLEANSFNAAVAELESRGSEILSLVAASSPETADDSEQNRERSLTLVRELQKQIGQAGRFRKVSEALDDVYSAVSANQSLSSAFRAQAHRLPASVLTLVELGHDDVSLQRFILRAINQLSQARSLRKQAYLYMSWSLIGLLLVFFILVFIACYMLPYFGEVFGSFHLEESRWTAAAVWISSEITERWHIWLGVASGLVVLTGLAMRVNRIQLAVMRLMRVLPGIGPVMRRVHSAHFLLATSVYLQSGAGFDVATSAAATATDDNADSDFLAEGEYENMLKQNGLLSLGDITRLRNSRDPKEVERVFSSLAESVSNRAENSLQEVFFTVLESATLVVLLIAALLILFVIILPTVELVQVIIPANR